MHTWQNFKIFFASLPNDEMSNFPWSTEMLSLISLSNRKLHLPISCSILQLIVSQVADKSPSKMLHHNEIFANLEPFCVSNSYLKNFILDPKKTHNIVHKYKTMLLSLTLLPNWDVLIDFKIYRQFINVENFKKIAIKQNLWSFDHLQKLDGQILHLNVGRLQFLWQLTDAHVLCYF